MRGRLVLIPAALVALAVEVTACSVVGDGKVERLEPQFGLDATTTSTTEPATSTTAAETTTTDLLSSTTQVPTELVRLYFITEQQLKFVATPLPADPSLNQIIAALQAGPPDNELGVGLRSAVPGNITIAATDNGTGVAAIQLPAGFFTNVAEPDQRLATAQLVLTVTDSRGIGQVTFNQQVLKPSGAVAPAGTPLSRSDFASLLEGAVSTTGTSTTVAPAG